MAQSQQLGNKDAALFRQVVRCFESKQYKKGLKAAEQILRKTPNHADTQAMKALIISHQGQQSEAFALAKIALGNNMKSHVCWHVYGLLYRADKNYDESIKAYKFALKLDPESVPIQRDLAQLQIQMRDYAGYIDSRKNMLQQKPGLRQNWTALAIAHHLAGNLAEAENILTTYEDTLKQTPPKADIEHWEAVLYKNAIIAETGQYEKALEHLEAMGRRSPDVLAVMEMRADYLLKLGRMAEAEKAYGALLHRNPDESAHYDTLLSLKNLDGENTDAITAFFQSWAAKFPRSDLPRRKPLDCLDGEAFRHAADAYLKGMLLKGVPATFANVKLLYADRSKHAIVQDLVEGYIAGGIETQLKGFPNGDAASHDLSQFRASIFYFLAQHYCHSVGRDLTKSFKYIDQALEIVPDSVDFHQTKARLLKYAGALPAAAAMQEKARSLDERDRAINTKCAKYQLRNDWNEQALTTMSKFTRNEAAGGPLGDLHDMQCVWYLTEDGKSYLRQHKLGLALKRFHAVQEIFETWQEDQFDFHNFSLRRGMIRVYIDTLRWENHLRDHPYYRQAAISAVSCYILLCDHPALAHGPLINGLNGIDEESPDNAAERKKALKKAKKEQQKLERAEAEKRESLKTSKASTKGADGESKKEDSDPLGKTLMETKAPLQDAMKFLSPLLNLHPQCLHAQSLGFEVFSRRGKQLLALKCLLAIRIIDPQNPTLHVLIYRFHQALSREEQVATPKIREIMADELNSLMPPDKDFTVWNNEFLRRHQASATHIQAGLRVRCLLDVNSKASCEAELMSTLSYPTCSLQDATKGLELLKEWDSLPDRREQYRTIARKRWQQASIFQSEQT